MVILCGGFVTVFLGRCTYVRRIRHGTTGGSSILGNIFLFHKSSKLRDLLGGKAPKDVSCQKVGVLSAQFERTNLDVPHDEDDGEGVPHWYAAVLTPRKVGVKNACPQTFETFEVPL